MKISKYRAWDKANKEMLNVDVLDFFFEEIRVLNDDGSVFSMKFENIILMQSTGLKDENGTEIFEGDIVKAVSFARWIGVVKYSEEKTAFMFKDSDTSGYRDEYVFLSQFEDGFEVLGNIYENPDILENA